MNESQKNYKIIKLVLQFKIKMSDQNNQHFMPFNYREKSFMYVTLE